MDRALHVRNTNSFCFEALVERHTLVEHSFMISLSALVCGRSSRQPLAAATLVDAYVLHRCVVRISFTRAKNQGVWAASTKFATRVGHTSSLLPDKTEKVTTALPLGYVSER